MDEDQLRRVALLADPVRRDLYGYILSTGRAVGRDEASAALGISRSLVAFHLDRLAAEGILRTEYRRLSGRRGPGAGRPAKLYRVAGQELEVTVPPRDYRLAAALLAAAVDDDAEGTTQPGLEERARATGRDVGTQARNGIRRRAAARRIRERFVTVLDDQGFAPRIGANTIELLNCPFHSLARKYPRTVCRMNLALIEGVVEGLDARWLEPSLERADGRCCVVVHTRR